MTRAAAPPLLPHQERQFVGGPDPPAARMPTSKHTIADGAADAPNPIRAAEPLPLLLRAPVTTPGGCVWCVAVASVTEPATAAAATGLPLCVHLIGSVRSTMPGRLSDSFAGRRNASVTVEFHSTALVHPISLSQPTDLVAALGRLPSIRVAATAVSAERSSALPLWLVDRSASSAVRRVHPEVS